MQPTFRTIALIGRYADPTVADAMLTLAAHGLGRGVRVLVDANVPLPFPAGVEHLPEASLASHAELLVSVGGDGTLLYPARLA